MQHAARMMVNDTAGSAPVRRRFLSSGAMAMRKTINRPNADLDVPWHAFVRHPAISP